MTEDEARTWLTDRFGSARVERMARFLDMVMAENASQNLIARATMDAIWNRHAADSAQLVALGDVPGVWLDIGTGGGFPGMIVAILRDDRTVLVEPRRRRANFLEDAAAALSLTNVTVEARTVEKLAMPAAVISARAVASLEKLLPAAEHCATRTTRWILPRGRFDMADMQSLERDWTMMFHVEHSVTDEDSTIVVLDEVRRR